MNQGPWDSGGRPQKREHRMGTWLRDRDEDLALFHDMRARERNNFLHPSNDDIEASLSTKFGGLSGYRISASTPTRKGTDDLLIADAEKNDYDWLLTPPGTPLFPSLDQDVPIINLSQRGALTRSASASKTSRLSYPQEPSPKGLRGNPSPRRPSTASSTSSTTSTARGRPSSPSITSPSPTLRPSPPSCRPTTPTGRASTTASRSTSRSSTPTLRRMNTSPVIRSSSVNKSGSSNGRSRGKSLSPKLRAWEPSIPGFSTEPPPNLRTSVSDRSSPRGGTLGSRHGGTIGIRNSYLEASETNQPRRLSTSPDASRSWSLSNSQDHNSSQTSKGSVVSSCDDDMEVTQSAVLGSKRASTDSMFRGIKVAARLEDPAVGRYSLPAKRQTRSTSTSGETMAFMGITTKKSLERQVDQRRSSQSMFRPLLSSVPASSFYSTRPAGGMHRRQTSPVLESSITISSNGSSEQGVRVVPENESSNGDDEEMKSTRGRSMSHEGPMNLVLDEDEKTNSNWADCTADRYQFSDHDRHNIDSCSGFRVLRPSKSLDGCELNEVKINMSAEEIFKERIQSSSGAEGDKERINRWKEDQPFVDKFDDHGHAVDDLIGLPSHRQNLAAIQCNEENSDHLFVDIQEDLAVQSHVDKSQGSQRQNFMHYAQSSEHQAPLVQATQLACPMELGDLNMEASTREESRLRSPHKKHECDMDIDMNQVNSQILNSSSTVQRFKGHDNHPEEDTIVLATKSRSLLKLTSNCVPLELSYESSLTDTDKPESTSSVFTQCAGQRVDWPVTDSEPFGRKNSMKNLNLRLQDGTVGTEGLVSCDVSASSSYLTSENLAGHTKKVATEGWARDALTPRGHEVVTSSLQTEAELCDTKEDYHEYSVDVLEATVCSESTGISRAPKQILFAEKPAMYLGKDMSMERKEMLQASSFTDPKDETAVRSNHDSYGASICDSLLDAVDQRCRSTGNLTAEDPAKYASQQNPELSMPDLNNDDNNSGGTERNMISLDDNTTGLCPEDVLSIISLPAEKMALNELQLCNAAESDSVVHQRIDEDILQVDSKLAAAEESEFVNDFMCDEVAEQDPSYLDDTHRKRQPGAPLLKRNVTLEEATDTILFCSSIVHSMVYQAAAIAIEKEDHAALSSSGPKGELVTLFGLSEAERRSLSQGEGLRSGNWKRQPAGGGSAVRRTFRYVQKQRMVHQQTSTVTLQQTPMDRTENAVMGNQEELTHTVTKVHKKKTIKAKKVKSRCRCTVM